MLVIADSLNHFILFMLASTFPCLIYQLTYFIFFYLYPIIFNFTLLIVISHGKAISTFPSLSIHLTTTFENSSLTYFFFPTPISLFITFSIFA